MTKVLHVPKNILSHNIGIIAGLEMVSFRVLESLRVESETKTESLTSESETKTETKQSRSRDRSRDLQHWWVKPLQGKVPCIWLSNGTQLWFSINSTLLFNTAYHNQGKMHTTRIPLTLCMQQATTVTPDHLQHVPGLISNSQSIDIKRLSIPSYCNNLARKRD